MRVEDTSVSISLSELLSRIIIISAGSDFESQIREGINKINKTDNVKVGSLIENFSSRSFWNMFNINEDTQNINNFLGFFGKEFKLEVSDQIANDDKLKESMGSFLLLLKERGKLAHEGFLSYKLGLSYGDSYRYYKSGIKLVEFLNKELEK